MATFYVRSSINASQHAPYPGFKVEAADADAAAVSFLNQFPAQPLGSKICVTPESAIAFYEKQVVASPTTPPTYA